MYKTIEISRQDGVAIVRLNRPRQLNALNATLAKEIISVTEDLEQDASVGAIVLTGSERAFAAGADISEILEKTAAEMIEADYFAEWERFTRCRTPKIAAVRGVALGGGCELMMMCDFAIAGTTARFGQPEVRIGVMPGMGGTQRMTRLIGRSRSMDFHLTGRMMDATEALQVGLVARVVPDDEVLGAAVAAARTIASYPRAAVRDARDAVMSAEELPLAEGLRFERKLFHRLFGSADQREGMNAFLEKRPPRFSSSATGDLGRN